MSQLSIGIRFGCAVAAFGVIVGSARGATLDDIRRAFLERERSFSTVQLKWTEVRTFSRRKLERMGRMDPVTPLDFGGSGAPDTVSAKIPDVVLLLGAGPRIRYETASGDSRLRGKELQTSIDAFDGTVNSYYMAPGEWHGFGGLKEAAPYSDARDGSNTMLLLFFRPSAVGEQINVANSPRARITNALSPSGEPCLLVSDTVGSATSRTARRLWIDEQRGFVPLRFERETLRNGRISRWDITYTSDEIHGLVPATWDFAWLHDRGTYFYYGTHGTTNELRINEPIAAEQFRVSFPVGTRVHDARTGVEFVVLEGGKHRTLASWDEELDEESGRSLMIVSAVAAALLVVAALVWRHRQGQSRFHT